MNGLPGNITSRSSSASSIKTRDTTTRNLPDTQSKRSQHTGRTSSGALPQIFQRRIDSADKITRHRNKSISRSERSPERSQSTSFTKRGSKSDSQRILSREVLSRGRAEDKVSRHSKACKKCERNQDDKVSGSKESICRNGSLEDVKTLNSSITSMRNGTTERDERRTLKSTRTNSTRSMLHASSVEILSPSSSRNTGSYCSPERCSTPNESFTMDDLPDASRSRRSDKSTKRSTKTEQESCMQTLHANACTCTTEAHTRGYGTEPKTRDSRNSNKPERGRLSSKEAEKTTPRDLDDDDAHRRENATPLDRSLHNPVTEALEQPPSIHCKKHRKMECVFFCKDCKEPICRACRQTTHRNHSYSSLTEVSRKCNEEFEHYYTKQQNWLSAMRDESQQLDEDLDNLAAQVTSNKQIIDERLYELKQFIDAQREKLRDEIDTFSTRRKQKIEDRKDKIGQQMTTLQQFSQNWRQRIDTSNLCELSCAADDLTAGMTRVIKCQEKFNRKRLVQRKVVFTAASSNGSDQTTSNIVGYVVYAGPVKHKPGRSITLTHVARINAHPKASSPGYKDDDHRYAYSVSQLGDTVYIAWSNTIETYDSESLLKLEDIYIPETFMPLSARDMASCNTQRCVYVYDANNEAIWQIKSALDNNGHEVDKWLKFPHNSSYRETLSVTIDGRVLLAKKNPLEIEIYDKDAQLVQIVSLPAKIAEPQHTIETPLGDYIVCTGGLTSRVQDVYTITSMGHVKKRFGSKRATKADLQLKSPTHLAMSHEDGLIYVSDSESNKVLVLDSRLKVIKSENVSNPGRLFYSTASGYLWVGRARGGGIDVYAKSSTKEEEDEY